VHIAITRGPGGTGGPGVEQPGVEQPGVELLEVELVDPDDLTGLRVLLPADVETSEADAALRRSRLGQLDDTRQHANLQLDELRRRAVGRVPADWDQRFAEMIAYATGRGWVAPGGTTVRAHLERQQDQTTT